jgi:small subunit ribosomal protein S1
LTQFETLLKGEDLTGKRFKFVVTDLDKKRIVLSQRKIADKEREEVVSILKSQWKIGFFCYCYYSIHSKNQECKLL